MEKEIKEAVEAIGKQASEALKTHVADATKTLEGVAAKAADEAAKNGGYISKDILEEYKAEAAKAVEKLDEIARKQGLEIEQLKQAATENVGTSMYKALEKAFEEVKDEVGTITKQRAGSIALKNVINVGGISAGNSYSGSAIGASISGTNNIRESADAPVFTQARTKPVLSNFVSTQSSNASHVVYWEENNRTGAFAVTAEGALKPFVGYSFTKRTADWRKATGRAPFSEEFLTDFPRFYSIIVSLMEYDCENDLDTLLTTDAIAAAAPYANASLAGKIDNADKYAAIGAVICQIQLANFDANVIALNPADIWEMRLQKGSDGHYVLPPFVFNNQQIDGIRVISSNKVAVGNVFVADAMAYQVIRKVYPEVRIGYAADTNDWARNQMTVMVEKAFFNYLPLSKRPAFVYTSFATVLTSIEKPA
jgi:hypothetical protein